MSKVVKAFRVNFGQAKQINYDTNKNDIDDLHKQNDLEEKIQEQKVLEIKKQADKIIVNAKKTADEILQDSKIDIENMRKKVHDEAKELGYNEGYKAGKNDAEKIINEANEIKESAKQEYNNIVKNAEKDIVSIIIDITKKVIGDELDTREELVSLLVSNALITFRDTDKAVIKVSYEDFKNVLKNKNEILKRSGFLGNLEVKEDASLEKGCCTINTSVGNVDCSINNQLTAIEKAFYDLLESE